VKNKEGLFLIFLIFILLFLVIFKPIYGWKLRQFLGFNNQSQDSLETLKNENIKLQSELAQLSSMQSDIQNGAKNYIGAMVYSEYPMNFKNEITLNVGSDQGVSVSKAVLFGNSFIGKTIKVFNDYSIVQTIFDGDFKIPVKIGNSLYDGLLVGGTSPKISSISKKASINNGDIIIVADPNFPYGIPIGTVRDVKISSDNLFQEATIDFAYDMENMNSVLVQK
jgi:rod shape-determining protein MreC